MNVLNTHIGNWTGNNGFRLMPADPLQTRPATATVNLAAGGHLSTFYYRWEHPSDGPQDGLVVVWSTPTSGQAVWADSWHQAPEPMRMSGKAEQAAIEVEGGYGDGWRWRIVIEADDPEVLRMLMFNDIPADRATNEIPAGPYPVMVMELGLLQRP